MTNSDRKRLMRSIKASAGIWTLALVLAIFVPITHPEKNVRLPAVRVELAVVPAVSVPSASPARSAPAETAPAKAPSSAKASPAPQKSPAAQKSAATKTAAPQSASGGLGIANFSSPVTASGRTASSGSTLEFASENVSPVSSGSAATVREFEGTAANVESKAESGLKGTASGAKSQSGSASADTASALSAVSSGAASGSSRSSASSGSNRASAVSAGSAPSAASSSGVPGISFDGASRKLLYPASPAIVLPERLARLVDSDRSVTVRFTVLADGSVPAALVEFTPQSVLPPEIRDWLRREFSGWRFEKASSDGQAQFLYSIRVK